MAVAANVLETYDLITIREDLANVDNMITPTETPFISMIAGSNTASATYHEWPLTNLGAVNTTNRVNEGEAAPPLAAPVAALRRGNYTQISIKNISVSSTTEWVDGAADIAKLAKQMTYAMAELKRDRETLMLQSIAAIPGSGQAATLRTAAGLPSFWQTNVSRGAGAGANPVLSGTTNGYPSTAAVAGTSRTITEDLFNTVMQSCWTSGGTVKYALVSPSIKRTISKVFTGYTTKYSDGASNKLITSVEIYQSDFGTVQIVPDRFGTASDVHFIDPDYVNISYGQPVKQQVLAKTGLAENRLLSVEYTLEVGNEASGGVLADVTA
jgi:hypothetical protein